MHEMHRLDDQSQFDIEYNKKAYGQHHNEIQQAQLQYSQRTIIYRFPSIQNLLNNITKQIHITHSLEDVLRKFKLFARQKKFKIIQTFENQIIIVQNTMLAKIKCFFKCLYPLYHHNVYRFFVHTDQYRSLRIITIENLHKLYQDSTQLRYLLNQFARQYLPPIQKKIEIQDQQQDIYSLQATSQYMFSKMLLEQKYSMGKKVNSFLVKFKKIKNSTNFVKSDIQWIEQVKDQIVQDMLQGFNCSRKQLTQILGFCRMIVQGFLYERIMSNEQIGKQLKINNRYKQYKKTLEELKKLNSIVIPYLLLKQIYWIVKTFQIQYDLQNDFTYQKPLVLSKLINISESITLKQKLKLLRYYTEINGQPEYLILFEKAYDVSKKK